MFFLHCGNFFPHLEESLLETLSKEIASREDPLRQQILVVVPTTAIRKRLLTILAESKALNLYGVNILSINHLSIKIALDTLDTPKRVVSDPLFFPFALYKIALKHGISKFSSYRICIALYQSLRDLKDGAISPELFQEVLEFAEGEPIDHHNLSLVGKMYAKLEDFVEENNFVNLQTAATTAAANASKWAASKNIRSVLAYGFYDSTQSQFDLLHNIVRAAGNAHLFFPFSVPATNIVEETYAQPFFDSLYFLAAALNAQIIRHDDSSRQISLFSRSSLPASAKSHFEFFNAAGPYDEVWAIAKRILFLVLRDNVAFDQIMIVCRSLDPYLLPITHVFAENNIPCTLTRDNSVSYLPFARFAALVVQAREARMNKSTLLEVLTSPFLSGVTKRDFRNLRKILDNLLIKNWEDWDRLTPLMEKQDLPEIFDFLEDDSIKLDQIRSMVDGLFRLKQLLQKIPETASLPEFASALCEILEALVPRTSNRQDQPITDPVFSLLQKLADYSSLAEPQISIAQFADLLKLYFAQTRFDPGAATENGSLPLMKGKSKRGLETTQPPPSPLLHKEGESVDKFSLSNARAKVLVGDIMQLRGISADYVFLMGLNKDVFPRRATEDPFLPDNFRLKMRSTTGAGPEPKKRRSLIALKEGTDEDLLLFSLALRSARRRIYLSYQRADTNGRKLACSAYIDDLLRLLTGKTSENNDFVIQVPKHHRSKFLINEAPDSKILPSPIECSTLAGVYDSEALLQSIYQVDGQYAKAVERFASLLNSSDPEEARPVDGEIVNPQKFWNAYLADNEEKVLKLSYSRFKSYLLCPFQFFSGSILRLEESPRDAGDEEHDMNALLKGRLAEDVVKGALQNIRQQKMKNTQAVDAAVRDVFQHYHAIFPRLILDLYLAQFRKAAIQLLEHLEKEGYDLATAETPQREDVIEFQMSKGLPPVMLRGVPDLLVWKKGKQEGLIGEFKWGARTVAKSARQIFDGGEAQFALYPAMVRKQTGQSLPFQYFRLNVFDVYGLPQEFERKFGELHGGQMRIQLETALRLFGKRVEPGHKDLEDNFEEAQKRVADILSGHFRFLKEPILEFMPCKYCTFTQLCRRSHSPTLLRSKQVKRP